MSTQKLEDQIQIDAIHDKKLQGINKRLLLVNIWSLFGALNYGYIAAAIGSTLGQPNFYKAVPSIDSTTLHGQTLIGTIVGIQSIGGALGVVLVCSIQDRYGRRAGYAFGIFFSLLGAALGAGFQNYTMLIFGRLFSGLGGWATVLSCVAYQSETAPATRRGLLSGSVGPSITFGYTIAAWVSVGFFFLDSSINFRAALIIQIFFPLCTLAGLPFIPESPRWLIFNGKDEEAKAVLDRLHSNRADPDHLVSRAEYVAIKAQTAIDRSLRSDWLSMFTIYKRRTFTIIYLFFSVQAGGIQIVTNYGPTIYQSLGLTSAKSLIVAGGWYTWSWLSEVLWALPIERWGRRPLLVGGQAFTAVSLAIMIALIAKYTPPSPDATNTAGQRATVFAFFWFVFAYSAMEPSYFVYCAETFPTHIRVKGIAMALVGFNLTGFWVTLSQPAGVGQLGWKYYLVMLVISVLNVPGLYFCIKETKGLALEEIAQLFGDAAEVAPTNPTVAEVFTDTGKQVA